MKQREASMQEVLEDITYILNEIRNKKFQNLKKLKLNIQQEKSIEDIEKDLEVCVTKLGLLLHPTEL